MAKKILIFSILILLVASPVKAIYKIDPPQINNEQFSFLVAGHAYGAHNGTNLGLYPKLLTKLQASSDIPDFAVFSGDFIRQPATFDKWLQVNQELENLKITSYFVLGNNDNSSQVTKAIKDKFTNTYYYFDIGSNRFIYLNTQDRTASISLRQLIFINKLLESSPTNTFIFFHELIWNQHPDYADILANNRSRYNHPDLKFSNFWTHLYPMLTKIKDKNFYLFAGDTGGRPDSIPAFYQKLDNIYLIASGMGEIRQENYLQVDITNQNVKIKLVPLRKFSFLKSLRSYTLK